MGHVTVGAFAVTHRKLYAAKPSLAARSGAPCLTDEVLTWVAEPMYHALDSSPYATKVAWERGTLERKVAA